jgi:hypothetical protein
MVRWWHTAAIAVCPWPRLRIARVCRRSSPIATAPKSTWRGLGSFWARPSGSALPRLPSALRSGRPAVWRWQRRFCRGRGRGVAARGHPQAGQGAFEGGLSGGDPTCDHCTILPWINGLGGDTALRSLGRSITSVGIWWALVEGGVQIPPHFVWFRKSLNAAEMA